MYELTLERTPYAYRSDIAVIVEHDEINAFSPPDPNWVVPFANRVANGEIVFARSYASVSIWTPLASRGAYIRQTIESGGVGGVALECPPSEWIRTPDEIEPTPADAAYLAEIGREQTEELLEVLAQLGVELR